MAGASIEGGTPSPSLGNPRCPLWYHGRPGRVVVKVSVDSGGTSSPVNGGRGIHLPQLLTASNRSQAVRAHFECCPLRLECDVSSVRDQGGGCIGLHGRRARSFGLTCLDPFAPLLLPSPPRIRKGETAPPPLSCTRTRREQPPHRRLWGRFSPRVDRGWGCRHSPSQGNPGKIPSSSQIWPEIF